MIISFVVPLYSLLLMPATTHLVASRGWGEKVRSEVEEQIKHVAELRKDSSNSSVAPSSRARGPQCPELSPGVTP